VNPLPRTAPSPPAPFRLLTRPRQKETPLLLTLAYLLDTRGQVHAETDLLGLYRGFVRLLFEGEYRRYDPPWKGQNARLGMCLAWLERIA
jgi:hypothetical protein